MEDYRRKSAAEAGDKDIVYSRSIKAGKRIYYLDVKKSRNEDMYLAITESKKIVTGEGTEEKVNFEKHKIFLYKEDFEKFFTGLKQAIDFIEERQGNHNYHSAGEKEAYASDDSALEANSEDVSTSLEQKIKIDIDF